ncbi:Diamine acetyltransferase 1 [Holothuria leucospilota]|uniref:Diamine acetyltransferase 1 n=1 Tax=Holothuria leucospilota TaxID=206669 RepID=A0A9Q1H293_HOLLE|nr:Diamine acetyltransferase 1 [Holothuria leucospilota]
MEIHRSEVRATNEMNKYSIRIAQPEDVEDLIRMAKELVTYGHPSNTVLTNKRELEEYISTWVYCIVLEHINTEKSRETVGYALWTHGFSTSEGKLAQLGSLYIFPEHRGRGLGYTLLQWVAKLSSSQGCNQLRVTVQRKNKLAKSFYEKAKVVNMTESHQRELYGMDDRYFAILATSTPVIPCSSKL